MSRPQKKYSEEAKIEIQKAYRESKNPKEQKPVAVHKIKSFKRLEKQ